MKNIKRNLSSRTLGFMIIGSFMMFAVPSFAQNHNPEFEISDVHLGGSDYVFIPPDAEATPFRTAVPLQYRDDNIPENGSTTLSWESGDKINVYEIGVTSALDLTQSPTWSDADQGDKSLELEAHLDAGEGDSQTLQAIYTNPDGDDSPVGEREFTLVKLDLDVDANYDGTIDDDDEADEASAGGLVFLNDDDDDQDGTPDKDQDGAVAGEDDLIEIKLSLDPDLGEGEVRLEVVSGSDNIKVWDDSTKTTEIDLSETWDLSSDTLPSSLFVEAIAESSSPRDVELILTYQPDDTLEITDSIVLTLLKVEFETFPDDVSGPDNAHKINLSTRQKEATFYGEFEKSVSHIWETDQTVDLIDYLRGSDDPSMRTAFEQALEWRRSNGEVLDGHELNYGLRPDSDEIERFDIEVLAKGSSTVLDRLILVIVPPETLEQFNTWYTAEADMGWLNELPALYWRFSFEQEGTIDPTLVPIDPEPANCDPQRWKGFSDSDTYYHPDGYYKARSEETQNGHGHQAIYTQNAVVIKSGVSAGSADKEVPFPTNLNPAPHVNADVKPFIWAAQLDGNPVEENVQTMTAPLLHEGSNIQRYFERRPAVANGDYLIPGLDDLVPGECDQ